MPTVNNAELTLVDTLAKPVIVVLPAARVVIPEAAPAIVNEDPPWIVDVTLANPVLTRAVVLAIKLVPTICEAALTLPGKILLPNLTN